MNIHPNQSIQGSMQGKILLNFSSECRLVIMKIFVYINDDIFFDFESK